MAIANYDKCALLLPMSGANNGTSFTDFGLNGLTVTPNGNAKTSTAQSMFYGSSGYFDGAGDFLSVPYHAMFSFDGDFTVAIWARFAGYPNIHLGNLYYATFIGPYKQVLPSTGWSLFAGSTSANTINELYFYGNGTSIQRFASVSISLNTWYHIAVTRSSGVIRLFLDGTLVGTNITDSSNITHSIDLDLGRRWDSGETYPFYFNGYLQDAIVIKGAALWTSNFTPPEKLIGTISGTVKDDTNANAVRNVTVVPRSNPSRLFHTTSAADGSYSVTVPNTECSVIVLDDDAGTLYNDLIMRVLPG